LFRFLRAWAPAQIVLVLCRDWVDLFVATQLANPLWVDAAARTGVAVGTFTTIVATVSSEGWPVLRLQAWRRRFAWTSASLILVCYIFHHLMARPWDISTEAILQPLWETAFVLAMISVPLVIAFSARVYETNHPNRIGTIIWTGVAGILVILAGYLYFFR
jgi:hypothetical protein